MLELHDAAFGYDRRAVVRVEELILSRRKCVGIFGPNGVGKTTLVRGLAGLLPPIAGVVKRDAALRFGYIQQHRAMELHWPMSALDVAALTVSARTFCGWVGGALPRVREQMSALGVKQLAKRRFATLSGGQQQRVLLAGALAAEPEILILDEPTDGLDPQSRRILLDRLRLKIAEELCVVLVSHEPGDLLALDAEIHVLKPSENEGEPSRAIRVESSRLVEHVMGAA